MHVLNFGHINPKVNFGLDLVRPLDGHNSYTIAVIAYIGSVIGQCNFAMSPHVRLLVGWLVGRSVKLHNIHAPIGAHENYLFHLLFLL